MFKDKELYAMNRVDFDEYSEQYDELMNRQLGFFEKEEGYFAEYKAEIIERVIDKEPAQILEYGCGIGRNLKFLQEKFPRADVSGCDVSQKSVEIAKKTNPDVNLFVIGKDTTDKVYDLILIANVLHHIAPDQRISNLGYVTQLLGEGGFLFIFEHNPLNLITRRVVSSCPFDSDAVLLRPGALRMLLNETNLEIKNFGYCLFFPGFLKRLRKLDQYLKWLPLGGQYYMYAGKPY